MMRTTKRRQREGWRGCRSKGGLCWGRRDMATEGRSGGGRSLRPSPPHNMVARYPPPPSPFLLSLPPPLLFILILILLALLLLFLPFSCLILLTVAQALLILPFSFPASLVGMKDTIASLFAGYVARMSLREGVVLSLMGKRGNFSFNVGMQGKPARSPCYFSFFCFWFYCYCCCRHPGYFNPILKTNF
jgi:hypothetical protein